MGLVLRGRIWWYRFRFEKQLIQESTKTGDKVLAKRAEANRRRELIEGVIGVDSRAGRARLFKNVADEYLRDYKTRNAAAAEKAGCEEYGLRHLKRLLGGKAVGQINVRVVSDYQATRKEEGVSAATINGEVGVLRRVLDARGEVLKGELKRRGKFKLPTGENIGKSYSVLEQDRLHAAAKELNSPYFAFALQLVLNGGLRDKETRMLTWQQIDFAKNVLTVGKSKSAAGTGRIVPLNGEVLEAFTKHREWYISKFHELRPHWYVFPFTKHRHMDPSKPCATMRSAWVKVRAAAGVKGRWHDTRHTVVTQLGESGASPTTIMATVGHVSRRMLERYSHPNRDAQRRAMEQMVEYRNQQREREVAAAQQFENKPEKPATVN